MFFVSNDRRILFFYIFRAKRIKYNTCYFHGEINGEIYFISKARIEKIILNSLNIAFSVKTELNYNDNYPVLYNDPTFTAFVANAIETSSIPELKAVVECEKQDPSEDFAYYAEKIPSTFIYAGCDVADGKLHPHHSPDFLMDEDCLIVAAKSMAAVTIDYLNTDK